MPFDSRASMVALAVALAACSTPLPVGPSVMVLPGRNVDFEQFQADEYQCRGWADQQVGIAPRSAGQEAAAEHAIGGAAIGSAAGAAIGAASGAAGAGAAIGAGSGLLLGSAIGGSAAYEQRWAVQQRYDIAYMQCMYSHGHQIPVARGSVPYSSSSAPPPEYEQQPPSHVPPPPRGAPPPPPPGR